MKRTCHIYATLLIATLASVTFAQDAPYNEAYPRHQSLRNNTRIIVAPRMHREVEVSRSLAAQPVHPHMVKVIIGGTNGHGGLSTYIDPMNRLDGHGKLDHNHSLVKAQRLYRSLRGVTTEQLNAVRADALQRQPRAHGANRAVLIVSPKTRIIKPMDIISDDDKQEVLPKTDQNKSKNIKRNKRQRFNLIVIPKNIIQPTPPDKQVASAEGKEESSKQVS